jgi:hypothetical protein
MRAPGLVDFSFEETDCSVTVTVAAGDSKGINPI